MNRVRRRELWGTVLLVAIAALVAAWTAFAWTTATGLTFVSAGPVALWAAMMRKR